MQYRDDPNVTLLEMLNQRHHPAFDMRRFLEDNAPDLLTHIRAGALLNCGQSYQYGMQGWLEGASAMLGFLFAAAQMPDDMEHIVEVYKL